ncbi:carboxylesterase/lipase family protein [Streptomyces sulphureus]|uniref:carboxylesterase/lipase family protein n=1 Tax=Streptomyces sulphureus TaxID=47758 RepID=UPI001FDF9F6B|nr:carboxylesterase family protein [Streptomyces sulphureus]
MSEDVVVTAQGSLQGTWEDGVRVFRGVPFAAAPVGPLRFRSPQPAPSWRGVRSAVTPGPASYQFNGTNEETVSRLIAEIDPGVPGIMAWPSYTNSTYRHDHAAEDCLYLDIWVPETSADLSDLPVYVYYHGGANAVSSGSFALERGATLARTQQVIVVRPNYRLGALGWVHFGLISNALSEAVNLGLQDQVAALRWVHENISVFGGDPDNITIGGESAGGTAVSHLLTLPSARGLFRRAVIQSLSPFNLWCTQQRPEAESVARRYLDLLGLDDAAALAEVDPDRLLAVQNVLTRWFPPDAPVAWRPLGGVVDGNWIPQTPARHLAEDSLDLGEVEVVIGFAKDEWLFFRGHSDTVRNGTRDDVLSVLTQIFGDHAAGVYHSYQDLYPDHTDPGRILSDIMSFAFFKFSSLRIAKNMESQNIQVRAFQFSYELPGLDASLHAVHTGDIPFLFGNHTEKDLAWWPAFDGIDRDDLTRVSTAAMDLYGAFIRGEDPGPTWPRFGAERRNNVLWLGHAIEPRPDLLQGDLDTFTTHGIPDVTTLENILTRNVRSRLATAATESTGGIDA